ncbi:MAG: hypothetical protein ACOC56_01790 [Atribacterota bacterium]
MKKWTPEDHGMELVKDIKEIDHYFDNEAWTDANSILVKDADILNTLLGTNEFKPISY